MSISRRGFLAGIIAAGLAPAVVKAEILMPVRQIIVPDSFGQRGYVPWKTEISSIHMNEHWMRELRRHAQPSTMFEHFGRVRPMPSNEARTIKFRRYAPFAS